MDPAKGQEERSKATIDLRAVSQDVHWNEKR